jgi:tetratricopeptide (TPR) repeat protein
MAKEQKHKKEYRLTGEPEKADHNYHYSPEVAELLFKSNQMVQRVNPKVLPRLIKLVKKYPRVPAFYNYISSYYAQLGNNEKAYETNRLLLKKFPDYLHAKLNLANEYLLKGSPEKMREILGENLELNDLYPARKVFHLSEYIAYTKTVILYLYATDELDDVSLRTDEVIAMVGPDPEFVAWSRVQLEDYKARNGHDYEGFAFREAGYDETRATTEPPVFHHASVATLHELPLKEAWEHFTELLQLPPETLIEDLKVLLQDTINRYDFWLEEFDSIDNEDFHIQAILLLRELDAEACFVVLMDILRQGSEFLDFWHDLTLTEEFWRFLYPVAHHHLLELLAFLKEPNIYNLAKLVLADLLNQIAVHHPDYYEKIKLIYINLMTFLLEHQEDKENICDPYFCEMLTIYVVIFNDEKVISLTKRFYEEGLCSEGFEGGFAARLAEFNNPETYAGEKLRLPASTAKEDAKRLFRE